MFTSNTYTLDNQTTLTTVKEGSETLSYRDVVRLWKESPAFRAHFTETMVQCAFDAFFWETPPVTRESFDRPFEFVSIDGPELSEMEPDPVTFSDHFSSRPSEDVLSFPNLGGDALLVVPRAMTDEASYTHLSSFLRTAPPNQVTTLWRTVGLAMHTRVSDRPVWLNTAGLGVSWLHLRLDSEPKYYRYQPYLAPGP